MQTDPMMIAICFEVSECVFAFVFEDIALGVMVVKTLDVVDEVMEIPN